MGITWHQQVLLYVPFQWTRALHGQIRCAAQIRGPNCTVDCTKKWRAGRPPQDPGGGGERELIGSENCRSDLISFVASTASLSLSDDPSENSPEAAYYT